MKRRDPPPESPVVIRLPGKPATAGSHVPFVDSQGRSRVLHDCKRYKTWAKHLRGVAFAASVEHRFGPHTGPVLFGLVYRIARPKGHWSTAGGGDRLHVDAPEWPIAQKSTLDVSKVIRAAEDALTGIMWADDAQIIAHQTLKLYCAKRDNSDEGAAVWVGGIWREHLDQWIAKAIIAHARQFDLIKPVPKEKRS